MLLYLDLAHDQWKKEGKLTSITGLKDAIMPWRSEENPPKIMTVSVILAGFGSHYVQPWGRSGRHEKNSRPHDRGVITSTILELIIYPAIYMFWKQKESIKNQRR
jgi:Cu(I)/Ag(I) efflux system membrane protein CusA/SilA